MTLAPGSTLGPYTVTAELGHGGMGVVYTAHDPRLDRQVAIKVLPPDLTRDDTAKQRFLQEAKAASALDHPNICTIHEINETADGQLYLVMAYYEGETLKERIDRGPLGLDDAVDIATQVGRGLAEAHGAGIVHRDIKPANLLIAKGGVVKILDFGLAKLVGTEGVTQTGATVGTVAYMSPEQARGEEVDRRTDIWSLGVVLYEMLAGQQPFQGENLLSLAEAIRNGEPPPLTGASSSVSSAITQTLRKDAAVRYQAVTDLIRDLKATIPETQVSEPEVPSIAVLPFADLSPEKDQDYFCDGLAEELIDALAKLDGLRVVGRTSSFQFRDKGHDLQAIGEQLKAKTVLEGSVRKAGIRLRINAQLINTEDGYHLWSERYDRTLDDVFEVQDDIARSVVDRLKVELLGTPDSPPARRQPNLDAYQLYLRGNHAARPFTREGFAHALTFYARALAKQSDYPEALSGTSYVYAWQSVIGWADPAEIMPQAKRLALEAMSIDATVGEAHLSLAQALHYHDWEFAGAEREYRRAIDLNPGSAEPQLQLAHFLTMMGRHDEARDHATRAIQLDPLDLLANWMLAHVNVNSRWFDAALDQLHRVRELGPTFWLVFYDFAVLHGLLGEHDRALSACTEGLTHSEADPFLLSYYGWICGMMGRREEAERIAAQLQQRRSDGYGSAVQIAWCYVGLRDNDRALEWLATAFDDRDGLCALFAHWPVLDPLRADPRFQTLLRRMNFPESAAPTS